MAEFVVNVRLRPEVPGIHEGDVIEVLPDGSDWGTGTLEHDFWRIICMPEVSVAEAAILLSPGPVSGPEPPLYRMYRFHLDHPAVVDHTRGPRDRTHHAVRGVPLSALHSIKPGVL